MRDYIWVHINAKSLFDKNGEFIGVLGMLTDITESKIAEEKLRENEEKYRNIVETASEGILVTDKESIITYLNKKMADMLGYTVEVSIGRPIWYFPSEESRNIVRSNLMKRQQGIDNIYESQLVHKDSSLIWVNINAKCLFDKNGEFIGPLGMLNDITKRKETEETLAKIEIGRKQEIHHRIKNNLQVISSLLDLQAEKFSNREDIKDSEVLEAFKESQDRVISMALIHEELYRGGELDSLDFSSYTEVLAKNLFLSNRLGNIDISLKLDLVENAFFNMDIAVPLGIIVNELVSNSFKHAFSGRSKGEIQIKLSREENGEYIKSINKDCKSTSFTLTVSDNGVGIPENFNIEDLNTLGMQLVSSLVDQLDGEFELKSDNGTEFAIKFPVTERSNQAPLPALKQLV
jgi:PAS domain S-box-containing protein